MATDRMSDLFGSSSVGAKDVEMAVSGGSSYSKLFKEFDAIKAMIVKIKWVCYCLFATIHHVHLALRTCLLLSLDEFSFAQKWLSIRRHVWRTDVMSIFLLFLFLFLFFFCFFLLRSRYPPTPTPTRPNTHTYNTDHFLPVPPAHPLSSFLPHPAVLRHSPSKVWRQSTKPMEPLVATTPEGKRLKQTSWKLEKQRHPSACKQKKHCRSRKKK